MSRARQSDSSYISSWIISYTGIGNMEAASSDYQEEQTTDMQRGVDVRVLTSKMSSSVIIPIGINFPFSFSLLRNAAVVSRGLCETRATCACPI